MSEWQNYVYTMRHLPKNSDWECRFCNITYIPPEGQEPNRFHRWMQELAFGVKWSRATPPIDKSSEPAP